MNDNINNEILRILNKSKDELLQDKKFSKQDIIILNKFHCYLIKNMEDKK